MSLQFGRRDDQAAAPAEMPRTLEMRERSRASLRAEDGRLHVAPSVLAQIVSSIGVLPAETGGVLGIDHDGVLSTFRFDDAAATTPVTYTPTIAMVNEERRRLERAGGHFAGFAHSHPGGLNHPSREDLAYAQRLLDKAKVDQIALPIVLPCHGTTPTTILWYVAAPGDDGVANAIPVETCVVERRPSEMFAQVKGAYDVEWLRHCRVVAIGCGGSRSAIEELVRCGVGEIVLIDPDTVEPQNLGTQHVYADEIGRPKVDAVRASCLRINPDAQIVSVQSRIEDVPAAQLEALLTEHWIGSPPQRVLIGLWTDDFLANAYGHRLALRFGLPAVWASLHHRGASGEVGLVAPGDTPACMRCALSHRYEHYLGGGSNDVSSAGAPLCKTSRLNALKVEIVLATLHAADRAENELTSERLRQDMLYRQIAARPLAVLRLAPDAREQTGVRLHDTVFAGAARPDALLFDETVWRSLTPRPGCPDCGGGGNLLTVRGGLDDPRLAFVGPKVLTRDPARRRAEE